MTRSSIRLGSTGPAEAGLGVPVAVCAPAGTLPAGITSEYARRAAAVRRRFMAEFLGRAGAAMRGATVASAGYLPPHRSQWPLPFLCANRTRAAGPAGVLGMFLPDIDIAAGTVTFG